eukprot:gene8146-12607_t
MKTQLEQESSIVNHSNGNKYIINQNKILGAGAEGKVFMAQNEKTKENVAIKCVKFSSGEGFPIYLLRELNHLKSSKHEGIVQLKDIITEWKRNTIFLVFEYIEHDLTGLIFSQDVHFTEGQIKNFMFQILKSVSHLHKLNIAHRDLKPSNILLKNNSDIKVADFGLSRDLTKVHNGILTDNVVTLWYRAPEILLGSKYDLSVDLWSIGCIFAEILLRTPLFPGEKELDQLDKIYSVLGNINEKNFPNVTKLKHWNQFKSKAVYKPKFEELFKKFSPSMVDLLKKFLEYDPRKRITAEQALNHRWFTIEPSPKPKKLPSVERNEFYIRQNRYQQQLQQPSGIQKTKKTNKQQNAHLVIAEEIKKENVK